MAGGINRVHAFPQGPVTTRKNHTGDSGEESSLLPLCAEHAGRHLGQAVMFPSDVNKK